MNKDLIEKLKKNEMPFCLLTKEEQKCLKEVGKEYCQYFDGSKWNSRGGTLFILDATYRIKPDYQSEPEYEEYEITANADTWLGCYVGGKINHWIRLYKVPALPNFDCFFVEGGCTINTNHVSNIVYSGRKVFARFRK